MFPRINNIFAINDLLINFINSTLAEKHKEMSSTIPLLVTAACPDPGLTNGRQEKGDTHILRDSMTQHSQVTEFSAASAGHGCHVASQSGEELPQKEPPAWLWDHSSSRLVMPQARPSLVSCEAGQARNRSTAG